MTKVRHIRTRRAQSEFGVKGERPSYRNFAPWYIGQLARTKLDLLLSRCSRFQPARHQWEDCGPKPLRSRQVFGVTPRLKEFMVGARDHPHGYVFVPGFC